MATAQRGSRVSFAWLCAVAAALGAGAAGSSSAQSDKPAGVAAVFKPLKPGLKVSLLEKGNGLYEIRLLNEGSVGSHVITEVGAAHLALEDVVSVTRTWIPITAIRSVTWTRVP